MNPFSKQQSSTNQEVNAALNDLASLSKVIEAATIAARSALVTTDGDERSAARKAEEKVKSMLQSKKNRKWFAKRKFENQAGILASIAVAIAIDTSERKKKREKTVTWRDSSTTDGVLSSIMGDASVASSYASDIFDDLSIHSDYTNRTDYTNGTDYTNRSDYTSTTDYTYRSDFTDRSASTSSSSSRSSKCESDFGRSYFSSYPSSSQMSEASRSAASVLTDFLIKNENDDDDSAFSFTSSYLSTSLYEEFNKDMKEAMEKAISLITYSSPKSDSGSFSSYLPASLFSPMFNNNKN